MKKLSISFLLLAICVLINTSVADVELSKSSKTLTIDAQGKVSYLKSKKTPEELGYHFIGCRPSIGECYHSCPTLNTALAIMNDPKCEWDLRDPVGCYCKL